jgi:ABC-type sugar transport system substrate-binding protein
MSILKTVASTDRLARFGLRLLVIPSLIALIGLGAATQASAQTDQKPVKITFLVPELANPFWVPAKRGAQDAAKQFGVDLNLTGTQQYSAQQYIALFQNALTAGAQALAITPGDPTSLDNLIDKAVTSGIPVGTVILDAPKSKRVFFTGPSPYQEGIEQGKRVLDRLHEEHVTGVAKAAITSCLPGATGQELRRKGFKDATLQQNPYKGEFTIDIVAELNATGEPSKNYATYQSLVTAHPDLKVMYPMCAIDTLSAGKVAKAENLKGVIIAGHDWLRQTIDLIGEGWITWSLGENPYENAYRAIEWLTKGLRGAPIPQGMHYTDSKFATPSNLDEIRKSPDFG